jgi:signal transduction histidine kinase/ligand-binding sensor domain-containing protein/DNA-binding response OmpR family regulator
MGSENKFILFFSYLSFILCLIAYPLHSSPQMNIPGSGQQFIVEQWTTNNGLPINHINQVYQTPDGFLWLATFNGLIRFDGHTFREFNAGNTPALTSNRIIAIQPGIGNSFWINTEQGHLLLVESGTFTSFENQFLTGESIFTSENRIRVTTDGYRTWIGTKNGLFLYSNGELRAFRTDLFSGRNISSIHNGMDKVVRVFDDEGVVWDIDLTLGVTKRIEIPEIRGADAVIQDRAGNYWAGRNEIARLIQNNYQLIRAPENLKKDWDQVHPYYLSFRENPDGSIMVMSLNGLLKVENDSLIAVDLIEYQSYGTLAEILGHSFATCPDSSVWAIVEDRIYRNGTFAFQAAAKGKTIYCDNEQNLWVATNRNGLFRYRMSLIGNITFPHSNNNFYGVFIDSYNTYWIGGTFSDVTQVDTDGVVHEVVNRRNEGTTATFYEASDRSLWNGYHRCRPANRSTSGACLTFEAVAELTGKNVFTVHEDSKKRMWFGTHEGLFRLAEGKIEELAFNDNGAQHPVRFILESDDSALWMATNGSGVIRYLNGEFTRYTRKQGLSSNNLRSLFEDDSGFIWIATEDMGLNRLDPATGKVTVIRKSDGLFEDGLHTMLLDDFGRMWISTNQGIFWVPFEQLQQFANGERNRVYSTFYNERDGMLNREANGGFQNAGFKSGDGRIFFSTQYGVVVIDPNLINIQIPVPAVILDNFMVGGESYFTAASETFLRKDQRSFSIQFTTPFFIAPDRVRYRYKLKGFDEEWIDAGSRREAIYTNIPAGKYLFSVIASLGDQETASAETTYAVVISPYFYETTWFPAVIFLLICFLIVAGYRLRLRHLIKKELILENIVARRTDDLRIEKIKTEKQAEQLKILAEEKNRFFVNISHEFRTPLTLTMGPLTDLCEGKYGPLSPEGKRQAELSLQNARRLLRLVGQLMDLSRLEEKKFEINLKTGNICRYLNSVAEPFKAAAIQKNIRFNVEIPEEAIFVNFDPGHFDKIVANLLSNAFKFTHEYGSVTLRAERRDDEAYIMVIDTGVGIEAHHLPRLFDRFYQIRKSELQPGSGIGLSLAKELTELHNGVIDVQSEVNRGSSFTIRIPLLQVKDKLTAGDEPDGAFEAQGELNPDSINNFDLADRNGDESSEESGAIQKSILIVDDHADIRAYLKQHLKENFTVLEAASGNEALSIIKSDLPDLIISDVMMQDGDGITLLKQIRSNPEMDFLPVILLTARAEAEDKLSGLGIGANEYITKPFNIREIQARLKNLFEQQMRLKNHIINEKRSIDNQIHHDPVNFVSADQAFLNTVKNIIQAELSDENFSVEDLAQKVNQSRSNLHRRLTKITGESPSAMIRRIRLELGAQLLSQNAGTVSEIAYSTGFKSVSHFSRVFNDYFGMNPSQYQESSVKTVK